MLYLKALIFIPANMLVAFLLVFAIRAFLFYPRREVRIIGKKIPLTPGLVPKYHILLVDKINDFVYGYLHDCETSGGDNRIEKWEEQVYQKCLAWLETKIHADNIPQKFITGIQIFLAEVGREFAKQFMRTFIPYLIENYKLTRYMDIFNEKFTIIFLQGYFDRYIYKYSLYLMLALGLIIGIVNHLIYLIIGG